MYPLNRLFLYARTLRHLRPSQLAYFVGRRILPRLKNKQPIDAIRPRSGVMLTAGIRAPGQTDSGLHFRFLNRSRSFESGGVGWASTGMPKLWRYNLHYFDYLQDAHRSTENKYHLISDWIGHNPPGTEDAWEPYTASLRIVNWLKFILSLTSASINTNPLENGNTG